MYMGWWSQSMKKPYFHRIFRKTDQSRRIPRKPETELCCEKISKIFLQIQRGPLQLQPRTKCENGDDEYPEKKNTILNQNSWMDIGQIYTHCKLQVKFRSPLPPPWIISFQSRIATELILKMIKEESKQLEKPNVTAVMINIPRKRASRWKEFFEDNFEEKETNPI